MYAYTATIGRNYSSCLAVPPSMRGQAMTLTRWERFIEDVKSDMLHAIPSELAEIHRGKGVSDGVEEESAKITVLRHSKATDDKLGELRHLLSENARYYDQDSIALTVSDVEFC